MVRVEEGLLHNPAENFKWKRILLMRRPSFLKVTLQASTRIQFWSSPDCEQRLLAKCFIFYL